MARARRAPAPRRAAWADAHASRRHERHTAVRELVLDAAYRLYVEQGYAGITMRALAEAMHCAPTAFYRYFPNKDEIVLALKEIALQRLSGAGRIADSDDPLADLRAVYLRFYEFSKAHPVYFRLLWTDVSTPAIDVTQPRFAGMVSLADEALHHVQRAVKAGQLRLGIDPNDVMNAMWCAVHGTATTRALGMMPDLDFDRMAARTLDCVISGVGATPARPRANATRKKGAPATRRIPTIGSTRSVR